MGDRDERIGKALHGRLDPIEASPALSTHISAAMARRRRMRRAESFVIALAAIGALIIVGVRVAVPNAQDVALAPDVPIPSLSPSTPVSSSPSPSPSPIESSTPTGDERVHFVSPTGAFEFDYPAGWISDVVGNDSGYFYNRDRSDEEVRPGDMKLEFSITDNFQGEDMSELQGRQCRSHPAVAEVEECERRLISGRLWVWSAVRLNDDFDGRFAVSIGSVYAGRVYRLTGTIFRGADVLPERVQLLEEVLLSARISA